MGVAVALDDGLIVPVIRDADRKSLREIAAEARVLAERARAGKLAPQEFTGGTFTISNLGMFGVRPLHRGDQPARGGHPRRRGGHRGAGHP